MPEPEVKQTRKFRSLTVTLAAAFLALSLVVLLIASGLQTYSNFQTQQKVVSSQQQLIAQDAANTVRSFFQEKFILLEAAVSRGSLVNTRQEERKLALERLLGHEPAFRQLVLLDAQGQEVVRVSRQSNLVVCNLTERVDGDMFTKATQGKTYASSIHIDEVTSEPLIMMAMPVTDVFGDFQGVLMAEVNLKFMWDLVGQIKVGDTGYAYVVDRQGNLIAYSDISRVLGGENLGNVQEVREFISGEDKVWAGVSQGIKDTYVVSTYMPLGTPDWAVVIELPVLEAYDSVINMLRITAGILLLGLVLAIVTGFYLSKRITRPILLLRDAAIKIGEGELDTQIAIDSKDEVGELASSFNRMAQDLRKSRVEIEDYSKTLEAKVDVRTKELEVKVGELDKTRLAVLNMMEDLQEAKSGLEDNVKERTEELQKAYDRLKEADQAKDDFLAITSHELKTPLTSIIGLTQLIQEELADEMSDDEKEDVKVVLEEATRLKKLIEEILELARLDAGRQVFKMVGLDVKQLAGEVAHELEAFSEQKGVKINVEEIDVPTVTGDYESVKRLLYNLTNNGVKYTSGKGSNVVVGAYRDKDRVVMFVRDNGIGIPDEAKEKVFDRFFQVDSSKSRKYGGTGLGLAICKKIVQAHNGELWFESKLGEGSTFYFSLPIFNK
jgi:methyl-accepting chemotaxis protein